MTYLYSTPFVRRVSENLVSLPSYTTRAAPTDEDSLRVTTTRSKSASAGSCQERTTRRLSARARVMRTFAGAVVSGMTGTEVGAPRTTIRLDVALAVFPDESVAVNVTAVVPRPNARGAFDVTTTCESTTSVARAAPRYAATAGSSAL